MNTTDVPFTVLRFQYQLARIPLQLIEEQMAAWMGSQAPPRVFYARSLAALDATVGSLLGGDPKLQKRGAALLEHSDALSRTAQLDAKATQKHEQAGDELNAKRNNAIKTQNNARAAKERHVKEARTAAAKQPADDGAAQRNKSTEAVKHEEPAQITAAEQQATAAAVSNLNDAQATRIDAASQRAQADQIEQLADVDKQKRQSEPSKDA